MGTPIQYTRHELVAALIAHGPRLLRWFYRRTYSFDLIALRSVAANTFRGFVGLAPLKPSDLYRSWAAATLTAARMEEWRAVANQGEFDAFHGRLTADLNRHWRAKTGGGMRFGPSQKLVNLFLKAAIREPGMTESDRHRLTPFLHVPLDSCTLAAIRRFATDCGNDGLKISPKASMGFVETPEMYLNLQGIIRSVCEDADVPPICLDLLVWDRAHGVAE